MTTFEQFTSNYRSGKPNAVRTEMLGDLDTPVSAFLKTTSGDYRFFLESVERGEQRGRYSFIGDSPICVFECKNGESTMTNMLKNETTPYDGNPLEVLQGVLKNLQLPPDEHIPLLNGGLFGYLGYDTIRYIEKIPIDTIDDLDVPDIKLFVPQKLIIFDNLVHKIHIIFFAFGNDNPQQEYDDAVEQLKAIVKKIKEPSIPVQPPIDKNINNETKSNMTQQDYEEMVVKAKKHITRGDIFQVVPSQRLEIETGVPSFDIYRALRVVNPSPYMFYMELGGLTVLGSSPETLVKMQEGKVYVKPIAGTCRRGETDAEDAKLIEQLLADPKEKAEHMMLVDLGRNDIGRIAEYGTVDVEDLMIIEKYSHVLHIVSTVSGKLKKGMDSIDVFKATFPAGTLTGAPKVRAMEIIEDIEPTRRGVYGGAVGYIGFDGNMDVCIAIRTILHKTNKVYIQAGAGVVADSVPTNEYQETLNKANGLVKALEYAEGGLA